MENETLCLNCGERPIQIKKRGLCYRCYHRAWARGLIVTKVKNPNGPGSFRRQNGDGQKREIEFIQAFFTHQNWIHHPAMFNLAEKKYTPDFYDGERNVFIEISGTRQAYHQNKDKYQLFRKLFPKLLFEIRKPSGELLDEEDQIDWQ